MNLFEIKVGMLQLLKYFKAEHSEQKQLAWRPLKRFLKLQHVDRNPPTEPHVLLLRVFPLAYFILLFNLALLLQQRESLKTKTETLAQHR